MKTESRFLRCALTQLSMVHGSWELVLDIGFSEGSDSSSRHGIHSNMLICKSGRILKGPVVGSHHAGALLGPGQGERGVPRPLAVQSDVRVHVYRDRPRLHYQYRSN